MWGHHRMVCNYGSRCSVWGHFWGTISQNPSIPKSKRLHIVICWGFNYEFEVSSFESIKGSVLFMSRELELVISQTQPFHL
jgi:hypothetical protein